MILVTYMKTLPSSDSGGIRTYGTAKAVQVFSSIELNKPKGRKSSVNQKYPYIAKMYLTIRLFAPDFYLEIADDGTA